MTTFTAADLAAMAALLRDAGRAEIMPRFRKLTANQIRTKSGPQDLVTDADEAAEQRITAGLRARFPGCLVVGEEATAANPALLHQIAAAPLVFVVDPIDGTANYAAGLPLFGVMAAAIIDGQVVAACIHDPVIDDSALALRGAGAWGEADGQGRRPLRVSPPAPFDAMIGMLAWRFLPEPRRSKVIAAATSLAGAWDFRCAAHHYRMLADGKCHFAIYTRLLPWDHAPGWLLHQEAGGHSARFDGSPYNPADPTGGIICAPDAASWTVLRDRLL